MWKALGKGLSSFGKTFKANMQDDQMRQKALRPFMSQNTGGMVDMLGQQPQQGAGGPPPVAAILPPVAPQFNIDEEGERARAFYQRQLRAGLARGSGYGKY